ncbi:MAG TPA: NACHT domain-containing protein [Chloroflexia bacterium]|nr:NACHT domain-containing protein [Chloroflexia bacterium]
MEYKMPFTSDNAPQRKGVIYTFYSYKGGAGRSMALANVAELLYQLGLKVLVVDWDLEAPGIERYFDIDPLSARKRRGLIELLLSYKDQMTRSLPEPAPDGSLPFETPKEYLVSVHSDPSALGRLWLLTAGRRAGEDSLSTYGKRVLEFNWKDFYDNWEGELYFEWLRQQFETIADVILIDSRTGATEIGGITTYQLADVVLVLCTTNEQSLEGAWEMANSFSSKLVKDLRGGRSLQTVVIPARIDDRAELSSLAAFQNDFLTIFRPFVPDYFSSDPDFLWKLKIPYFPKYSFSELVAVREEPEKRVKEAVQSFANIVNMMARLEVAEGKSLKLGEAVKHLQEVVSTGQPITAATEGSTTGGTAGSGEHAQGVNLLPWELAIPILSPKPECPYPGMVPFDFEDAPYFRGRTAEIRNITQHLRSSRFLIMHGPSGCGKTSLVQAGLVPELLRSSYWPAGFWQVLTMRPGSKPTSTLADLMKLDSLDPQSVETALVSLLALQRRSPDDPDHVRAANKRPPAKRLALIVDQFEELFSLANDSEQEHFVSMLDHLLALQKCALVIVVRTEAFSKLLKSRLGKVKPTDARVVAPVRGSKSSEGIAESLGTISKSSIPNNRIVIGPLRGAELREAIQQPASDVGVKLDTALVERLMYEAGDEPGRLPLVQGTLASLWDHVEQQKLSLRAYEALGQDGMSGLATVLVRKADTVLESLTDEQQLIAQRIFLRLVQFGEGRPNTRRQQPIDALRTAREDTAQFEATLAILVDQWLVISNGSTGSEANKTLDIAHEALVTSWPALQSWIAARSEAEQARRNFDNRALDWINSGKSSQKLLNAQELKEVQGWLESHEAKDIGTSQYLLEFAAASESELQRSVVLRVLYILLLASGAIISAISGEGSIVYLTFLFVGLGAGLSVIYPFLVPLIRNLHRALLRRKSGRQD